METTTVTPVETNAFHKATPPCYSINPLEPKDLAVATLLEHVKPVITSKDDRKNQDNDEDNEHPSHSLLDIQTCVPEHLIARFETTIVPEFVDKNEDGNHDTVILGSHTVTLTNWLQGQFNFLDQSIQRDDTHKVSTNEELIAAFNDHPFQGSKLGQISGYGMTLATFGVYTLARRKVVPPGYFGHYVSTQRHKFIRAGVHTLMPTTSYWCENVLIDDEVNPNRKFGDKHVLQVPENHLAGGYRIGADVVGSKDQEFVLFSQGRHVLPESKYYGVTIVKLDAEKPQLQLGPLTILYVREGWLGGCNHRKSGRYTVLYPGPPYVLHEQDYEAIELVRRTDDVFKLGPYQFLTVKAGQIAGAFRKADGTFQLLPPGSSYQLHTKQFQPAEIQKRKTKFSLGPYYYLTARNGYESGVRTKRTGVYQRLLPGKTYRLSKDKFEEPDTVRRDSHVTVCGPITLLTVEEGTLNGAYRVSDGVFVEFQDMSREYVLHNKEYYGLVTIQKYSSKPQSFGPFKTITIREGYVGLFEREGKIEIKPPGHYMLSSEYMIFDPIPIKMFQEVLTGIQFRTKDGIAMEVKVSFTWNVTEPELVARFAGTFADLRELLIERATDSITRLCKSRNRGDLLPTKQDLQSDGAQISDAERAEEMDRRNLELLKDLAAACLADLTTISRSSKLGLTIVKVQIDRFQLKDAQIMKNLEDITKSELAAKAEKVRGAFEIARASANKEAREKQAEADASVALHQARAAAEVRRTEFEAKVKEAEAENTIRAATEATQVKIQTDKIIAEAEAKASAIKAVTEAEYQKAVKEREAAGAMDEKELELKKLELQVAALAEVGRAAWKYPDVYTAFLETFGQQLRYGPMTAAETLARTNKVASTDCNIAKATSFEAQKEIPVCGSASSERFAQL